MSQKDLRKYQRQTNVRLMVGFFVLLVVVGGGLIAVFFGPRAALLGVLCMGAAAAPLLLISLALNVLDAVVRKINGPQ